MKLRIAGYTEESVVDGTWDQVCHLCPGVSSSLYGLYNPETWDFNGEKR